MRVSGLTVAAPAATPGQPVAGAVILRGLWRWKAPTQTPRTDLTCSGIFNSRLCHFVCKERESGFHPRRSLHVVRALLHAGCTSSVSASLSSRSYSTTNSSPSGPDFPTSSPSASVYASALPASSRLSFRWFWRLLPLAFPIVGFGYYWEQRRWRMYTEGLPALRSRFQGDTPFYGKLWGNTTDYFLETSFADGDLVFFSRDPRSLCFSRAVARAFSRFFLFLLAGGATNRAQHAGTGGGMFVDDIGVVYVENGQRYVVSVSAEKRGLEKIKYADKIAESFPETILVRRLRCSPAVREKLHRVIEEALCQSECPLDEGTEPPSSVCSSPHSALPHLNFRNSCVSVWSSFWTEIQRRRAASADAFRLLTAQAFWTAKRHTARLLDRRLEDLLREVESVAPANVMEQARAKTLALLSENGTEKEMDQNSEGSAAGTPERLASADERVQTPSSGKATESPENGGKTSDEAPRNPQDPADIVADLLALSGFAHQAVKRIDNVFQDGEAARPPSPAPKKRGSRLPIAEFPVAIYQAAQLLPPTPASSAWTPEDLLGIDTLFQPRDLPALSAAVTEVTEARGGEERETPEKAAKRRRSDLARQAALELASLAPQLAPILYVREEKGERDCGARKNMPGLIRQRERTGRNAAASGVTATGTQA
ncbi:hypothetical protein TGRUB_278720 [Toxoplasma gondii RUB]|uniref:Uncharacterized protein n=1 Tax=Toxoplasma gondii RUB TaxID=935652 RepID=A0A086LPH2_TOXGO|nr:hypothetical protein TGRUB_278720 [Toxoplasma gondii RUB]